MIIDVDRFVAENKPHWQQLQAMLDELELGGAALDLQRVRRLHYLYERASSDLSRLSTFASSPENRQYLETLVARAYRQVHQDRSRRRIRPVKWFFQTLPATFRRHVGAFWLGLAATLAGCLFGGGAVAFDRQAAKEVILPFEHLAQTPTERVEREKEQARGGDHLKGRKTPGAAFYMTHNTQVAIFVMALGALWGAGTIVMLFYNGVILGVVCVDYVLDGQGVFMAGWLLPHGSVEIPAILLAGQAGLVLGRAIIGWGDRSTLKARLRSVYGDMMTLMIGVALLLVWAGIIEAFLSQYHEPVVPYWLKISFGSVQLCLLAVFLALSGRSAARRAAPVAGDAQAARA